MNGSEQRSAAGPLITIRPGQLDNAVNRWLATPGPAILALVGDAPFSLSPATADQLATRLLSADRQKTVLVGGEGVLQTAILTKLLAGVGPHHRLFGPQLWFSWPEAVAAPSYLPLLAQCAARFLTPGLWTGTPAELAMPLPTETRTADTLFQWAGVSHPVRLVMQLPDLTENPAALIASWQFARHNARAILLDAPRDRCFVCGFQGRFSHIGGVYRCPQCGEADPAKGEVRRLTASGVVTPARPATIQRPHLHLSFIERNDDDAHKTK
ncbi:hypothetical protein [Lacticaseibacillus mingshuiensis]|uniref:Uncharacterized protein n=1 Tax=Lacticaseibacillus mingshuiensis TaxID=2799574 RepID=A0ABW4CHE6_9LACO|nr:hypothetical protein [Lacticaseibacillus mingshuiensis]